MKICYIIGDFASGGVEAMIYNYICNFDFSTINLHIISYGASDNNCLIKFQQLPIKIHVISPKQKFFQSCYDMITILKEEQFDIVHSHMTDWNGIPLALASLARVPVRISHSHMSYNASTLLGKFFWGLKAFWGKRFATAYCACGHEASISLFGKQNKRKVHIIKNAIQSDLFLYNESTRNKIRTRLNLDNNDICVGCIARFVYQKNHEFVFDIFDTFWSLHPNSKLLLIGDGPLKNKFINAITSKPYASSVVFLGTQNDTYNYYQAMDAFILPSRYEGLGMVAVEAQVAGLKTFVSDRVPLEVAITN